MKSMIAKFLIGMVLLFIITAAKSFCTEYTFDYQKIIEITEPLELNLQTVDGNITILGSDDNRIIIEAVKTIRASNREEAEEVADHIEIKVIAKDNNVNINTNYLRILSRSRSFWNKILGTGSSESFGKVDYRIWVPLKTSVSITSMKAIIKLSSIEGEVKIDNSIGSAQCEYIFGAVTISQPVGEIILQWIEGDIRVRSNSSRITIQQIRGAIDLVTLSSSVTIQTELDSPRNYFVETTSGSISFLIPTASSGILDISTETGEINTEVPVAVKSVSRNRLIGKFGEGGLSINLFSTTGDVNVNFY
ncbi:MAG: hypothetical protein ACE5D6_04575 [Candidatus Zixiibacteriota bacterium]